MRITLTIWIVFIAALSCQNSIELETVSITGRVHSNEVKEVKFLGVIDNSIGGFGEQYVVAVDSNQQFSIEIPIDRIAQGRISAGNTYQSVVMLPGDNYNIDIFSDSVYFEGKGAEKNNFLFLSNKMGTGDRQFASEYNKGKLNPIDFINEMNEFKKRRLLFLDSYTGKDNLESVFIEYYKIETQIFYENKVRDYPRKYARKNKIPLDSLKLPEEYLRLSYFDNFLDDQKVMSFYYVRNLRLLVSRTSVESRKRDTSLSRNDAILRVLIDSLKDKTQEYVMAQWLITEFGQNRYDTLLYNTFLNLIKDINTEQTVEKYYQKFLEKQSLLGQSLHPSFVETIVIDTSETQLSFKEMMKNYEGKVVYLDIWSLKCAPCLSAMPHSNVLKERLVNLPIEFVYLAQDPPSETVWNEIFEASFTNKNQYRMFDYVWGTSPMLKYLEIQWVPCYMIFDKEGKLINFNADHPYLKENTESELEKTLKQLAMQ